MFDAGNTISHNVPSLYATSPNCAKGREQGNTLTFSWSLSAHCPRLSLRRRETRSKLAIRKERSCVRDVRRTCALNPSRRGENANLFARWVLGVPRYVCDCPRESERASARVSRLESVFPLLLAESGPGFTYEQTKLPLGVTYRRLTLSRKSI